MAEIDDPGGPVRHDQTNSESGDDRAVAEPEQNWFEKRFGIDEHPEDPQCRDRSEEEEPGTLQCRELLTRNSGDHAHHQPNTEASAGGAGVIP